VTLLRQGIGLGDPQRALPTPAILWFCENKSHIGGCPTTPAVGKSQDSWSQQQVTCDRSPQLCVG